MSASIDQAAASLAMATFLGACIGFERQWRQRMAGLRTNTLVAIGAASFVVFEGLFSDDASPTRVAAQVVSGIGFLGAGIIFREGLQVTGLNTAATLWCSAAVGLLAGSGHPLHATLVTLFVVLVNLTLRPLFVSSTGNRSRKEKPTCATTCAWYAKARKRRMCARCFCRAPAAASSACDGSTATILRRAGAWKSPRNSHLPSRTTQYWSRWSVA
jgi:uncharacterized membrane protein YhiD involved in acid resistance